MRMAAVAGCGLASCDVGRHLRRRERVCARGPRGRRAERGQSMMSLCAVGVRRGRVCAGAKGARA